MNKTIGIAGLGWLGLPLAQRLHFLGYPVKGSVTQTEKATTLQKNGFDAYALTLTEKGVEGNVQGFLKNIDLLIVMIPPGLRRNTGADYVLKMTHFLETVETSKVSQCIFISSTSVYSDEQGAVNEGTPPKPDTEAGRQLHQVEQLFFNASFKSSIVRFGGLFGGSRQPVRFLAGRQGLNGGAAPVNLIHREDCIGILLEIIQRNMFGHIFNAVHPSHPEKANYYIKKAKELELSPPSYSDVNDGTFKMVNSINVPNLLGYEFKKNI